MLTSLPALAFAMSLRNPKPPHPEEVVGPHFWCRQGPDGVWRVDFLGEFVGLAKTREEALRLALGAYQERVEWLLQVYPRLGEDGGLLGVARQNLSLLRLES